MSAKIGARLYSCACAAEAIVVSAPNQDVEITCGGERMVTDPGARHVVANGAGAGSLLGKRYEDEPSGLELLVTKAGSGELRADGRLLAVKDPKRLPSSD